LEALLARGMEEAGFWNGHLNLSAKKMDEILKTKVTLEEK
jgi:hypothetical protein